MTPADLANLEKAATPGPWRVTGGPWERAGIVDERQTEIADGPYERHADHALIVALRNSARELIGATEERDRLAAKCRLQKRELKRLYVQYAAAKWALVQRWSPEQLKVRVAELKADNDKERARRHSHESRIKGLVSERDTLRTELDAIHETFGGAPSWASVAKNLIDARAQRDAAEDENDRLRAREAEWVKAVSVANNGLYHTAECSMLRRAMHVCDCHVGALRELIRTAGKP